MDKATAIDAMRAELATTEDNHQTTVAAWVTRDGWAPLVRASVHGSAAIRQLIAADPRGVTAPPRSITKERLAELHARAVALTGRAALPTRKEPFDFYALQDELIAAVTQS